MYEMLVDGILVDELRVYEFIVDGILVDELQMNGLLVDELPVFSASGWITSG